MVVTMPFTPFHLGPALLIGLLFFPYIDITVICIASVIIDVEPAYYLFFTSKGPYHGIFHSYLMATLVGVALSIVAHFTREQYLKILRLFGLQQETNVKRIISSALIGTYSHIFLDMFMYPEMKPFYPLEENPFLYQLSIVTVYEFCIIAFILAFLLCIVRVKSQQ